MSENPKFDETEEEQPDEEEYEEGREAKSKKANIRKKYECNRIDELAKPGRWKLLATWKSYGYLFEPKRMQAVKERVQELFSMSPEETELYFNTIRQKNPRRIDLKVIRQKIKKEKALSKREANTIFHKLVKRAMKYAYKHSPPLLMTPVLRMISDHILELLSELHGVDVPKRTDTDNLAQFLIAISDWTAIFAANIYYKIEVNERDDVDRLKIMRKTKSEELSTSSSETATQGPEKTTKVTTYDADADKGEEDEEGAGESGEEGPDEGGE